jgi:hypothetical protein
LVISEPSSAERKMSRTRATKTFEGAGLRVVCR